MGSSGPTGDSQRPGQHGRRPEPSDARAPEEDAQSPPEQGWAATAGTRPRRGPLQLIWRTIDKAWWDNIFSESAAAAFWQTLSMPPLLLGLLGSLGFLGDWFGPAVVDAVHGKILSGARAVFSGNVVDQIIGPTVEDILTKGRSEIVSVGFLLSLWAGSSALASLVDSITMAYDQYTVRHSVWQRIFALLLYLAALLLAVVGLPVIALGPEWLPTVFPPSMQDDVAWLIQVFYFPATGLLLVLALATLYKVALPRKLPWHRGVPGALVAMAVFLCSSVGLRWYITWVTGTGYTYGALATPIAFLLFAFFIGLAIIIGAQFNQALQELWPAKMTRRERRKWRRLEMRRAEQQLRTEEGYRAWRAKDERPRAAVDPPTTIVTTALAQEKPDPDEES
ncbi:MULTISPECIES: YihY/virulence factor BrkB family protein [unclassified Saccharopolyspora]|uniref:YihY/virulence factor BrkB family protein n=1 Tax=unclassified Saccharopolyspora TaxID=2646250 RepID=UPI001CD79C16|nr:MULTISPECIES: YihY/virulence factor BrkB family protein [unclassified Saccharopolyspora]MCA1186093.1 YihY/virulence factor BrkB family protein [Saccharopolyspora sp. 6T]MCA1193147.1 YihY/virulence factor BrkB family protein [Saccharopolyspora sp. 6V]MCA1224548.1 YihY/virulence factor BrkB family protein [Saccharopolyspora sp. 6M]MCA1279019.1 YihY/virulence factor BrkB family protein [Saccharopolyspora sp. 7B]